MCIWKKSGPARSVNQPSKSKVTPLYPSQLSVSHVKGFISVLEPVVHGGEVTCGRSPHLSCKRDRIACPGWLRWASDPSVLFDGFYGFMEFFCFTVNRNCNGVECDTHARCVQSLDNSLQCDCDSGWQGDGQNCSGKM